MKARICRSGCPKIGRRSRTEAGRPVCHPLRPVMLEGTWLSRPWVVVIPEFKATVGTHLVRGRAQQVLIRRRERQPGRRRPSLIGGLVQRGGSADRTFEHSAVVPRWPGAPPPLIPPDIRNCRDPRRHADYNHQLAHDCQASAVTEQHRTWLAELGSYGSRRAAFGGGAARGVRPPAGPRARAHDQAYNLDQTSTRHDRRAGVGPTG
jgi:hypothetical protein